MARSTPIVIGWFFGAKCTSDSVKCTAGFKQLGIVRRPEAGKGTSRPLDGPMDSISKLWQAK
jgi:hypothetical protein